MAKPTIVTRAGKGAPLSTTEGDSNFTNLRDATFSVLANGVTVSNELNSSFEIEAGTGITVAGNNTSKKITITNSKLLSGETAPTLGADLDVATFKIVTTSSNRNIELDPHGTGVVAVTGPMTISGNLTVNGTTTTVNSTTVDIADKNITLAKGSANKAAAGGAGITIDLGTDGQAGFEYVQATDRFLFDRTIAGSFFSNAASNFSGGTVNLGSVGNVTITGGSADYVLKTNGSGVLSWVAQSAGGIATVSADTTPSLGGNLNVNGNSIVSLSSANINIAPNGSGKVVIGSGTQAGKITSSGEFNLQLSTNNGENSGTINITQGINGDITLVPNGTGKVRFNNVYSFPTADGSADQFLKTNGSGQLSFATVTSSFVGTATSNLNMGTNSITTSTTDGDIILTPNGTGFVRVGSGSLGGKITSNGAYNLILNTNSGTDSGQIIINQGINGNIAMTPNGTGKIRFYGVYNFPIADGSADQFLKTDGSGNLTFATPTGSFVGTATSDLNMATFKIKSTSNQNLEFETASGSYGMNFKSNTNKFGYLDSAVGITTNGAGNLTLSTNSGTTSGTIVITNGADGNITLAPNGAGKVYLNGAIKTNTTSGTPTTYNTSYFEGTLDTPAGWLKVDIGGTDRYLPFYS
jgi:uncharacterized protein YjlB